MDFKTAKKIVKKLKYVLISWDWKEEVNIVQLSRYTQRGYVYLYDLDTDSDEYVIACSKTALTPRERQAIEWASFGSDEEENDLLSHSAARAVPSARAGLTSVFGMGTGVSPPL